MAAVSHSVAEKKAEMEAEKEAVPEVDDVNELNMLLK